MEKYFALIKDGLVESVIVANDDFLTHVENKFDLIIDVTNLARPSPGDSYYSDTQTFVPNEHITHSISADMNADHLQQGTEEGFAPFKISKYTVSYDNGFIVIGCKKYSAPGFMDALHRVLIEKEKTVGIFSTSKGPAHGKFGITWGDAQMLYNALVKVKF